MSVLPDTAFLRMEGGNTPMHIGCILTFQWSDEARADAIDSLLARLRRQPLVAPFDRPFGGVKRRGWRPTRSEKSPIDMAFHVRHSALPRPGGERALGALVARLQTQALNPNRPLWVLHVIDGLVGRRFAIYMKVHRSLADVGTLVRHLGDWLSEDPAAVGTLRGPFSHPVARPSCEANSRPGGWGRLLAGADQQWVAGRELARVFRRTTDREGQTHRGLGYAATTPRTPLNARVTAQRRLATQVYELARFERLRDSTGARLDDIALAIVGGALRRYLMEYNALPEQSLTACISITVSNGGKYAANPMVRVAVPLSTDLPAPLERLRRIRRVTYPTLERLENTSTAALGHLAAVSSVAMLAKQVCGLGARLPPSCNLTTSNVSGPSRPLYLDGARLESIYPFSPLFNGYALDITLTSYADTYCLGFVGCRQVLPHLQRLAVYTGLALEQLERASQARE